MAKRPVWKGQLRLSLVSIAVELYTATNSGARISFRQIHEPSGKPVKYQKVVPGVGPVDTGDIVKGYELGKDDYVLLDPEEVDAIRLETKKTMEVVQFVGACEIPPLYYDKPYYLVPADDLAQDAYRVVRDALRRTEKTGLCQVTLRGREHLAAIRPCGDGLLLETLHYADEIAEADPLFRDIADDPPEDELLEVAEQLIEKRSAPFDASAFKDNYAVALRELVTRKTRSKGAKRVTAEDKDLPEDGGNVVDLMAALKQSLDSAGGGKGRGGKTASRAKSTGRKTATRKKSA
ncbi:Ku protein [Rhodobacteraceae bacterium 2CG4]|uniref:Non-homologous end joining protein Ku n=1 Tax=Halovulum marinum TaxID=2662447 RepID=A0A6L5YYZ4_9RHOB|nr:Ku protein [Halovulum marinum]MSU89516.1 Ku protein [Halovulum marinum]